MGSCVKVLVNDDTHYGVIRWIGSSGSSSDKLMAAIELVLKLLFLHQIEKFEI